jgi:hypothetical protein
MNPMHAQESKVRKGLAPLHFDNAGLALVTNLVNGAMWELAIWTSLGSTVVLGRYACLGLASLQRWRTVLINRQDGQTGTAGAGPEAANPAWHASCKGHG